MPDSPSSKTQLRNQLRQQRRKLSPERQAKAGAAAAALVPQLASWPRAKRIGLYLANDGELETGPLARLCRETGKTLFLPVISADKRLSFATWTGADPLMPNQYGIGEPAADSPRCAPQELDIIFLPLVGWDRSGGRLGMGGGYYDRTLAGLEQEGCGAGPLLVGLAHALQEVARVPRESWDVAMDFVVTNRDLHDCRQPG
jgi:5-formyltetrahydrofolate cyclo-ligase